MKRRTFSSPYRMLPPRITWPETINMNSNNPNDPEFKNNIRAQLEKHGVEQVKILMHTGGWPHNLNPIALEWLKEKNQEAEHLTASSQAEMAETASRAAIAAERAAIASERAASAAEEQARAAVEQARAAERAAKAAEAANKRATIALVIAAISVIVSIFGLLYQQHEPAAAPPSVLHGT